MKVIALSGWKGSGKDALAEYLVKEHGYIRVAFADALKRQVAVDHKLPIDFFHNPKLKESPLLDYPVQPYDTLGHMIAKIHYREFRTKDGHPPMDFYEDPSGAFLGVMGRHCEPLYWTPRAMLIVEGNTKRAINKDYWIQKTIDKMFGETKIVISDVRFQEEAAALTQSCGKYLQLVRINRDEVSESQDISENDLNNYKFHVIIENKGTLEELYEKAEKLL